MSMINDPRLDEIAQSLRHREGDDALLVTGLMLAEEAGEAVQQLRRHLGRARQSATPSEVGAELADVIIVAAVLARLLDVSLADHVDAKLAEGVR